MKHSSVFKFIGLLLLAAILVLAVTGVFAVRKGITPDGYDPDRVGPYGTVLKNLFDRVAGWFGGGEKDVPETSEVTEEDASDEPPKTSQSSLTVEYLYVGQADCTLICADDRYMLIDGGNTADGDLVCDYLSALGIQELDYVVVTHGHEDHYGGLRYVIREFGVDNIFLPLYESEEYGYRKLLESIESSGAFVLEPETGKNFTLGKAVFTILSCEPVLDTADLNESSIVLRMDYGDTSWLFMSDAEAVNEQEMLRTGENVDADILKVGHHGSYSASCDEFLENVTPDICVISCGADNEFEHPHDVTMRRLEKTGAEILRTDVLGTIQICTDGSTYEISYFETDTDGEPLN